MNGDKKTDAGIKFITQQRRHAATQMKTWQDIHDHLKAIEDYLTTETGATLAMDSLPKSGDYRNMALSEAIRKVLDDRSERSWRPPQMGAELRRGGFVSKASNFNATIASTLIRLAQEGKIVRDRGKSSSKYRSKGGRKK